MYEASSSDVITLQLVRLWIESAMYQSDGWVGRPYIESVTHMRLGGLSVDRVGY